MYLNSGLEGEESVYVTSDDGFYRLKGYSIYYDKNQMMQDYMICRKDVRRVESGAGDRVIRDFRERMEDRKKEAVSQRHTVRNLGLLCSTMSMVILAGGVAMMNNYQKMQEMETVLVSVLPEGARPWDPDREEREESAPVIVEEIKGRIYPKTEEESNRLVGSSAGGEKGEEIVKMEPDPEKTAEIQEKQDLSQETALESSVPELPAEAQPESQNSGDGLREPESQGQNFRNQRARQRARQRIRRQKAGKLRQTEIQKLRHRNIRDQKLHLRRQKRQPRLPQTKSRAEHTRWGMEKPCTESALSSMEM